MRLLCLSSITIIILSGCQTSDTSKQPSPATIELAGSHSKARNYSIPASAGVEQLVSQAIAHHPSLTAAQQKINRLQAKVPQ